MCRIFTLVGVEHLFECLSRSTIEISTVKTPSFYHNNTKFADFKTTSRFGYRTKTLDIRSIYTLFNTLYKTV